MFQVNERLEQSELYQTQENMAGRPHSLTNQLLLAPRNILVLRA